MTQEEFAQKIKAKYPQYQSVDTGTLVNKIVEKYPQYKSQINDFNTKGKSNQSMDAERAKAFLDKSTAGQIFSKEFLQELPKSAYETVVGNALKFVKSAVEAPVNIGQTIAGKEQTTLGLNDPVTGKPVGSFQTDFQNKILPAVELGEKSPIRGTVEAVGNPLLGALDVTGAGELASGGAKGISAGAKAISESIPGVATKTGELLKGAGESAYGLTVPMQESTKIAQQAYEASKPSLIYRVKNFVAGTKKEEAKAFKPTTEANTAARKGLIGTEWGIGVQSKKIGDSLYQQEILPRLQAVKSKVNMKDFFGEIEKGIIKNTPELGRRNDLLEGLKAFKEDYSKVGKVSLEKLQDYKSGWAKFVPDKTYKGKPIAGAFKEVQNLAADKARNLIYKYIGEDGKQAYIDYGNLKSIQEAGRKSIDQLRSKGMTRQAWEFILDTAVTPATTFAGKVLYKTGEGLELFGKKGAKTIRDIVNQ